MAGINRVWRPEAPLRFIEAGGMKILQQLWAEYAMGNSPHGMAQTGEYRWADVPMQSELLKPDAADWNRITPPFRAEGPPDWGERK